jgi:tetratricopeptide (TPR) repeat protein
MGNSEEELLCYDLGLDADLQNAGLWRHKGDALQALGRFDEALASYERARSIEPGSVDPDQVIAAARANLPLMVSAII